jgi:outer membrane protein OmpA-like peptidoglycan-associated protein
MKSFLLLAALAGVLGSGSVGAVELYRIPESRAQYSAEEVVKAFAAKALDLGVTRSLCVGTDSECKPTAAPKVVSSGFDLLISFDYQSDELTAVAKDNLTEFARALRDPSLSGRRFTLEGYTDARGTPKYNLDLSKRRAESVKRYLAEQGVSGENLAAVGHGPARPRVKDPFDAANRRVEARVID